jgi:hypothetical protein
MNFDLLHPIAPPVCKLIVELQDMISTNIANRKLLLNELKSIFAMHKPLVDARCEPVNGVNIVAAVHGHIVQLAAAEHLEKLHNKIHETYADVFKPVPHVNEMLDTVQCKIELKDADKTITS